MKYNKTFEIPNYDTDKHRRITPISILTYLGETSGAHTDSIGFSIDKLKELNYGWMLNRWKVKILRYPSVREKIRIETWTSSVDKFYATREFIIYDEDNKEVGRASTVWIFLNMEKKRPIRIPVEFIEKMNIIDEKIFEEFYDFKQEIEIEEYIDFNVRRSDIDYNNHVNNTKYLSWMLETISEDVYENCMLNEFEILYKKETTYGNIIRAGGVQLVEEEDNLYQYFHQILDKDNKENHAIGITKWKRKR